MTSSMVVMFHAALLNGFVEIMGEGWDDPFIPSDGAGLRLWFDKVSERMCQRYGQVPAEGIAVRVGACAFTAFIQSQGTQMGISTLEFRLQPVLQRIHSGLLMVCDTLCSTSSVNFSVKETADAYMLQVSSLPVVMQYLFGGFFQEYFEWASNGKVFLYEILEMPENSWQLCFPKTPFDH